MRSITLSLTLFSLPLALVLSTASVLPNAAAENAPTNKYWQVEDAAARARLPLYETIPAATPAELTPSDGLPKKKTFLSWSRSHGDNGGRRYSALAQINRENVATLQPAWTYHSGDAGVALECNPIVVNGVMYVPTPGNALVAVDAATGKELWRVKPGGRPAFRGLIYWPGTKTAPERILFCSGKYFYALDPKTGRGVPNFGANGRIRLPSDASEDYGDSPAAPTVFQNILVMPGFQKDVWGFDVETGRHLWTFHTIPHPGEFGYDTWDPVESYGANAWSGMAMDEDRGIAYIGTGAGKPNFNGVRHRGLNLFANCIIAIDARSGQRLWHFQEIRHDIWDLDITGPPNLATITRDGRKIDVVTAVTKMGNTLLLDRVTGKPIFPFRLRRAPTSDMPGEVTWPYQPDLELPQPFSKLEFDAGDLTDRSPEAASFARNLFKGMRTGRFLPCTDGKATLLFNIDGGAEWTGSCIDQDSGRLYVTANHIGWAITLFRDDDPPDDDSAKTPGLEIFHKNCATCHGDDRLGRGVNPPLRGLRHRMSDLAVVKQIHTGKNAMPAFASMTDADAQAVADYLLLRDRNIPTNAPPGERPVYSFAGYPRFYDQEGYPANKPPWGTLTCIDLNSGKIAWQVPLGEYPELAAEGLRHTGTENYGGAIVTAGGLVFCSGTRDNKIRAFDKNDGTELWSAKLPFAGSAAPATYEVNGRQYVVIPATGVSHMGTPRGDTFVAFALPPK